MKTIQIVVGILAIFPLALLADHILFQPGYAEAALQEMAFMIFGAPILVLNMWA